MLERAACGLERPLEIFEDVAGLQLDVGAVERKVGVLARFRRHAALEIARELAGREDERTRDHRFRVIGKRPRRAGFDDVDFHGSFSLSAGRCRRRRICCFVRPLARAMPMRSPHHYTATNRMSCSRLEGTPHRCGAGTPSPTARPVHKIWNCRAAPARGLGSSFRRQRCRHSRRRFAARFFGYRSTTVLTTTRICSSYRPSLLGALPAPHLPRLEADGKEESQNPGAATRGGNEEDCAV